MNTLIITRSTVCSRKLSREKTFIDLTISQRKLSWNAKTCHRYVWHAQISGENLQMALKP